MATTKVFRDTFQGKPIFAIWEVDSSDRKKGKYPVVSFGLKKAQAIQKHSNELNRFIQEGEREAAPDLSKLSTEEKAHLQILLAKAQG